MKNHIIDGVDIILLFGFLTSFANHAEAISMCEAQVFVHLPKFLEYPT